jgi:chromosome segregation ATPase
MLKKLFLIVGGLTLLAALFFGRDAVSYISTSVAKARQMVKDNVNVEFEIERARNMIKGLVPEIRRNKHTIALEEAKITQLEEELGDKEGRLVKSREHIMRLQGDLDSGQDSFVYVGHTYSRPQVTADLKSRFERHKTLDATVANLHKVVHARKRALEGAREKLEAMVAAKRQLEVEVENLEARQKMVEVAKATSEFDFDDSQLARTRELITEISTRIDVEEKVANSDGYFYDEIPLDEEPESGDISQAIAEYFGKMPAEVASTGDLPK